MISQDARSNMVKQQLRTGDVLNEKILELYNIVPRESFVPANMREFAYSDMQIPLPNHQRMFTPLEEGTILQALQLQGTETVLEVGTGSGYLTALLSKLAKKVISIEYFQDLSEAAAKKLAEHECNNVELITGDAARGWVERAPYDVVIMGGAIEFVGKTLQLQVIPGGKLITILGKEPLMQCVMFSLSHDEKWQQEFLFETYVPELIDKLKPKEFVF